MASAKKKQDEKNLKILRELVSQSGNKECFDCQQRGPTYVNMTIGSFVCTTCSGMLRGLTPPHRVKSISMATFTQDEIDFLEERGNEFCRDIWLGLMSETSTQSSKDEQKIKDFMSAKYELKRYYLDPAMASQFLNQKIENSTKSQTIFKNSVSKASLSKATPLLLKPNDSKLTSSNTTDFVADFSKVPAPLPLITTTKYPERVVSQPSFANFDNNPIFNSSTTNQMSSIPLFTKTDEKISVNTNTPPSEDRYAALKDLDSMMKQANLKDDTFTSKVCWNMQDTNNAGNTSWSSFEQMTSPFFSNPFDEEHWQPSTNISNNNYNNNNNFQQMELMESNIYNTANPFRQTPVQTLNNDCHYFEQDTKNIENVPSSHLSNKYWQPSTTKLNPFVIGSEVGDKMRNSNNPFL